MKFLIKILLALYLLVSAAVVYNNLKQPHDKFAPSSIPLNHAVNLNSLSSLTYWTKGVVSSAKTTVELKGTIVKIEANGKVEEHGWPEFSYGLKIRLQAENGDGNDIFLSPEELTKTTFKDRTRSHDLSYKDLKLGDRIQVFLTFDLAKDFGNNFVSAEIIKLSE